MKINIFAKNIKLTEGIKDFIDIKLSFLDKFLKNDTVVNVTIEVTKDIQAIKVVTVYQNQFIEAESHTTDLYISIEDVTNKLQSKFSRLHDCAIDKYKGNKKIYFNDTENVVKIRNKIVKRKSFGMKPMSEGEAILQMNLLKHSSFMFINADMDCIMCLLYKRKDGNYGIIEGQFDEDDEIS